MYSSDFHHCNKNINPQSILVIFTPRPHFETWESIKLHVTHIDQRFPIYDSLSYKWGELFIFLNSFLSQIN